MTFSDFMESAKSEIDEESNQKEGLIAGKKTKNQVKKKKKGCFINCWKMATHTKILPQERLYKYLADRSIEIDEDELQFSKFFEQD